MQGVHEELGHLGFVRLIVCFRHNIGGDKCNYKFNNCQCVACD